MENYLTILLFIIIGFGFSCILISIPFFIGKYRPYKAKLSPYECGVEPNSNANQSFDVQFYLVAMLFIIFDLEIVLLFPWAINLVSYSITGFISAVLFMLTLGIGLIYEYKSGALNW